jgi:hypothetical protein
VMVVMKTPCLEFVERVRCMDVCMRAHALSPHQQRAYRARPMGLVRVVQYVSACR